MHKIPAPTNKDWQGWKEFTYYLIQVPVFPDLPTSPLFYVLYTGDLSDTDEPVAEPSFYNPYYDKLQSINTFSEFKVIKELPELQLLEELELTNPDRFDPNWD